MGGEGSIKYLKEVGAILKELFNFDGQVEGLCCMSEMEGEFGMSADDMISKLRTFIEYVENF